VKKTMMPFLLMAAVLAGPMFSNLFKFKLHPFACTPFGCGTATRTPTIPPTPTPVKE